MFAIEQTPRVVVLGLEAEPDAHRQGVPLVGIPSAATPISALAHSARVRRPSPGTSPGSKLRRVEMASETGQVTGTRDKDYNIIWFTEACLSNVLRLETYIEDAEREDDSELADFFRRAQGESRRGAEQGKALLAQRLAG
jgi:hypothetical protein